MPGDRYFSLRERIDSPLLSLLEWNILLRCGMIETSLFYRRLELRSIITRRLKGEVFNTIIIDIRLPNVVLYFPLLFCYLVLVCGVCAVTEVMARMSYDLVELQQILFNPIYLMS